MKGVDSIMNIKKVLSIMLILILAFSTYAIASDTIVEDEINLVLTLDETTVKHGDTLQLDVFVESNLMIEGGIIKLISPFSEGTVISPDGATYTGEFILSATSFDTETPILTIKYTIDDTSLEAEEEFTISIDPTSYILVDGKELSIAADSNSFTVTIDSICATINLIDNIDTVEGITATLNSTIPYNIELNDEKNKIIVSPIRVSSLNEGNNVLVIGGKGFVNVSVTLNSASNRTLSVNGFYPGDVNNDNKIDSSDFNSLCSYIWDIRNEIDVEDITYADLNRDGIIDTKDVALLIKGYVASGGTN